MERMTRHMDGVPASWALYNLIACDECKATTTEEERDEYGCPWCDSKGEALGRLGQYEDSGLTPERAAELGKADDEGRLVVLPLLKREDLEGDLAEVIKACLESIDLKGAIWAALTGKKRGGKT